MTFQWSIWNGKSYQNRGRELRQALEAYMDSRPESEFTSKELIHTFFEENPVDDPDFYDLLFKRVYTHITGIAPAWKYARRSETDTVITRTGREVGVWIFTMPLSKRQSLDKDLQDLSGD